MKNDESQEIIVNYFCQSQDVEKITNPKQKVQQYGYIIGLDISTINILIFFFPIMCFWSVYRIKQLISIGIVITLLVGISLLYTLVYSFIISSITIQVQSNFRTLLITIFLSTSLLMILSSLSGIYGLVRRKNKFVGAYAITMIFYMVSFATLATITLTSPPFVTTQCQSSSNSDYQATYSAGKVLFCEDSCPCYYTNQPGYSQKQLNSMGITNYSSTNMLLPINAQNCETWNNDTYPLTVQMSLLEMVFNCSGWCQPEANPYYIFSNINYGTPTSTCVEAVSSFLSGFGHIILISSFTVGGFILIVLVIICCLCIHPDRGLHYDSLQIFKQTLIFVDEGHNDSKISSK